MITRCRWNWGALFGTEIAENARVLGNEIELVATIRVVAKTLLLRLFRTLSLSFERKSGVFKVAIFCSSEKSSPF
jgi:hypothetical protein